MTPESTLLRQLLLAAPTIDGVRLFRNQVGRYQLMDGRWINSGLCVGSPDLVGWVPVTIGPKHVGTRLAVFLGIEAKAGRRLTTPEQAAFLAALQRAGGRGGVARHVDELAAICSGLLRL